MRATCPEAGRSALAHRALPLAGAADPGPMAPRRGATTPDE